MRKLRFLLAAIAVIAIAVTVSACNQGAQGYIKQDVNYTRQEQMRLERVQPNPVLTDSGDRFLQRVYYTQLSDPSKIQYLTLMSLDGSPIGHFTIKGPVANTSDELTNPQQLDCEHFTGSRPDGCGVVGLPEPNGVYQGNSDTHFALTTSGALIKWQGPFIASDQPFDVKEPVKLTLNESAPVTHTDTSHITNGIAPGNK